MGEKLSREVYLARADYAEEQATKTQENQARQSWLFVAGTYRKLAEQARRLSEEEAPAAAPK